MWHQTLVSIVNRSAELYHEAVAVSDRLEETQDARCDQVGVESGSEMVHQRQILPVGQLIDKASLSFHLVYMLP